MIVFSTFPSIARGGRKSANRALRFVDVALFSLDVPRPDDKACRLRASEPRDSSTIRRPKERN
jgi:hypothetical protein